MKPISCTLTCLCLSSVLLAGAEVPENLVLEGIPAVPADLRMKAGAYSEFRAATFRGWHPVRHEMLITTRFGDTTQLHRLKMAGGARRQLTFSTEPVGDSSYQPKAGDFMVFSQDMGGGEFYQLYRYDESDGRITLLTDGRSRNTGMRWSHAGNWLAHTSTRRNGKDNDVYLLNPADPASARLLVEVEGGGWSVEDWSPDDSQLILLEYLSINESRLYLADAKTGTKSLLTAEQEKAAFGNARFSKDGKAIYLTTDQDSEWRRLARLDLGSKKIMPLDEGSRWDVTEFELSPDGRTLALVRNEEGVSHLQLLNSESSQPLPIPQIPWGVISGVEWHKDSTQLGFTLASAKAPGDVYALGLATNGWQVNRWTESEVGGLNPVTFVEPELIKLKSFDGLQISAFVYRPDPARFPGRRPVIVNIHGGPESQARPVFQGRNNYYLNELGIALVYPNVRGSAGYGKTFLTLDNGFKREDSVRDIETILDWVAQDSRLAKEQTAVVGGSYGGYMVLASLVHFGDRLRCGVDVVGISNFLTFLKNTQDYRRDLRRAEYGDERAPEMERFLERISPFNQVQKIKKPLLVVQGRNDPRVPLAESEQMVQALRAQGSAVSYLMAKDEGHGFAKKKNADFQFLVTILFLQEHLLR